VVADRSPESCVVRIRRLVRRIWLFCFGEEDQRERERGREREKENNKIFLTGATVTFKYESSL
jgi:hypothetical protein